MRSVRTNELQLQYLRPDTVFSTVRSVRTNELQQKKNIKEYVNRPVRFVRTNESQLSWTGVRRPLPRVHSVCTNELQRLSAYRQRPTGQGAPCACPRITTQDFGTASVRFSGCALCAQTNYNEHRESTTDTRAGGRSVRTNELQPVDTNDFDVLRHGTPRAHPRITTWRMTYNPAITARVCLMRAHELQLKGYYGDQLCYSGCASRAPMNYNCSSLSSACAISGCAPCAPMDYNITFSANSCMVSGALRAHP